MIAKIALGVLAGFVIALLYACCINFYPSFNRRGNYRRTLDVVTVAITIITFIAINLL